MAKVKNFQVVIEVENGVTIFDSTNSKKEVQEWIDAYTANGQAKSVTVYERNEKIGAYEIARRVCRNIELPTRLVGFGRWD